MLSAKIVTMEPPTYEVSLNGEVIGRSVMHEEGWVNSEQEIMYPEVVSSISELYRIVSVRSGYKTELIPEKKVMLELDDLAYLTGYKYGSCLVIAPDLKQALEMMTRFAPEILPTIKNLNWSDIEAPEDVVIVENILDNSEAVKFAAWLLGSSDQINREVILNTLPSIYRRWKQ